MPVTVRHSPEAMTGRGLPLVAALSDTWGVETMRGGGKAVWAELTPESATTLSVAADPEVDLDALGTFDVVLFLGVLYHLTDPFGALRRLALVTDEVAVIETAGVEAPGNDDQPAFMFFPNDELLGDPTNWWAPNEAGLVARGHAAGFSRVETRLTARATEPKEATLARVRRTIGAAGLTWGGITPPWRFTPTRIVAHAWK